MLESAEAAADTARVLRAATSWEEVFHGNPSGIDAAAAAFGGCIRFRRGIGPEPLHVGKPLKLALAVAGPPASTKEMVAGVRRLGERRPDVLAKALEGIRSLVANAATCIAEGDHQSLGELMNLNQMLLSGLMVSSSEIEHACGLARDAGALGAKLTGAGGGGCVVAVARDDASAALITEAWQAAGMRTFLTEVAESP